MTSNNSVRAVAALDDPQRARLYAFIRSAAGSVTREDAAAAVGMSRKLAAFHLDRLVDAGLLEASFDRPADDNGRIGRAPKRYQRVAGDIVVAIPERHYDFLGEILIDAVSDTRAGETPTDAAARVAHDRGHQLGERLRHERRLGRLGAERAMTVVAETLADLGFEPCTTGSELVQRNCPFHHLAQRSPELVCGLNREFVAGLLDGLAATRLRAELAPAERRCCVVVTAS